MRTKAGAFATHLAGNTHTIAHCVRITRSDATVYGFTDHDNTLSVDIGAGVQSFVPSSASQVSPLEGETSLAPESASLLAAFTATAITAEDVRAGRYDGATVVFFMVDWTTPADYMIQQTFIIAEIISGDDGYEARLESLTAAYEAVIVQETSPKCRNDLGDTACGVTLNPPVWAATTAYEIVSNRDAKIGDTVAPTTENGFWYRCTTAGTSDASEPTWPTTVGGTVVDGTVTWTAILARSQTGTVSVATSRTAFTATGISILLDHWKLGHVIWLTGLNAGSDNPVKSDNGAGVIGLSIPTPRDVTVGDTFTIRMGCARDNPACQTFENIYNRDAEDYIPRDETVFFGPS